LNIHLTHRHHYPFIKSRHVTPHACDWFSS
jgi:hypothetical protein